MGKIIDLTGQRFGRLIVISKGKSLIKNNGGKETTWDCICDCGNFQNATTSNLRHGRVKSCGCLIKDKASESLFEDLTGQKFGRLLVLKRVSDYETPKNHKTPRWLCLCDCGKETIVRSGQLKSGKAQSCGCYAIEQTSKNNSKEPNKYIFYKDYVEGFDEKGNTFKVSLCDYNKIKDYHWSKNYWWLLV